MATHPGWSPAFTKDSWDRFQHPVKHWVWKKVVIWKDVAAGKVERLLGEKKKTTSGQFCHTSSAIHRWRWYAKRCAPQWCIEFCTKDIAFILCILCTAIGSFHQWIVDLNTLTKNSLVYNCSVWGTTLKEAFVQANKGFKFVTLEWV